MELKYKLLEHPFYQAWLDGEITPRQLSKYHKSYKKLVEQIPLYWYRVTVGLDAYSLQSSKVISEEISHISLWDKWSDKLPEENDYPQMKVLLDSFEKMKPSELLGALHSFEIQQPGVALTKKNSLIEHYNFVENELTYFDEHLNEAEHIKYGKELAENFANPSDFKRGFDSGSKLLYDALDVFMNAY